ncbi:hypothetical protein FYK55_07300 [Roseiconus nitratireducens]|uniref:Uncharacterized protein n=1 Tax=Roseiconus nitratireducens TaxID=2605748 RepID=A0A5M6DCZ7_9BACT|nr:hypothetical protein [Roseiconus nitratireducens]KAA5545447.1 hypothetical protein FYK55_07300 [Roseiconus nitratireducens]
MQMFRVPSGIHGEVRMANRPEHWIPYTTKMQSDFDEPVSRTRTTVVFRSGRWLLRVKRHDVQLYNGIRWIRMK